MRDRKIKESWLELVEKQGREARDGGVHPKSQNLGGKEGRIEHKEVSSFGIQETLSHLLPSKMERRQHQDG